MAQYTGIELVELTDDELQAVGGGAFNYYSFNNAYESFNGGANNVDSFNDSPNSNNYSQNYSGNVVVGNDF